MRNHFFFVVFEVKFKDFETCLNWNGAYVLVCGKVLSLKLYILKNIIYWLWVLY